MEPHIKEQVKLHKNLTNCAISMARSLQSMFIDPSWKATTYLRYLWKVVFSKRFHFMLYWIINALVCQLIGTWTNA